ncbi:MAG TPA: ABC transporter ATP-binding protein [Mycobacteriales bacterium]|nr:ABC transporter ATP-binding protein [Mycobacteriales bacterium]
MSLLEVSGLQVAYGGLVAVRDVSFAVEPGQVLAMLGANGAGKTTTLRAVSGLVKPRAGTVTVDGSDVTGWSAERIARLGIAHVPAGRGVFGSLTVEENLVMARYGAGLAVDGTALDEAYTTFPVLAEKRSTTAGTLSGGQQQQLAIARALLQQPRVLLVDEMSMGLAPKVVQDLFGIVAGLKDRGIAIVMVEQFVTQALAVADTVVVLEQGEVAHAGTPAELGADTIAASYLGGHLPEVDSVPPAFATERVAVSLQGAQVRALERLAAARGVTVDEVVAALAGAGLEGAS